MKQLLFCNKYLIKFIFLEKNLFFEKFKKTLKLFNFKIKSKNTNNIKLIGKLLSIERKQSLKRYSDFFFFEKMEKTMKKPP